MNAPTELCERLQCYARELLLSPNKTSYTNRGRRLAVRTFTILRSGIMCVYSYNADSLFKLLIFCEYLWRIEQRSKNPPKKKANNSP